MEKKEPIVLRVGEVTPTWTKETAPNFFNRTTTEYVKLPLSSLGDRGLSTDTIEGIIKGLPDGCYVGGGLVTSMLQAKNEFKDVDVFCTSETAFVSLFNLLSTLEEKPKKVKKDPLEALMDKARGVEGEEDTQDIHKHLRGYKLSPNFDIKAFLSDSVKNRYATFVHDKQPPIQIMRLGWYDSPEHVIDTFDFTIVQAIVDRDYVYMNPLTPLDLSRKRLVLHRMQFPASTLRRLIKYTHKGYFACPGSLVTISQAIIDYGQGGRMDILTEDQFVYLD